MMDWDFQVLFDRGMLDDVIVKTEFLGDLDAGKRLTIYQGFDPTAPNLHIGHLLSLRVLRWFQAHGHRVIFLIGDFTGRIGDPSERPEARRRLSSDEVTANAATYRTQIGKILDLDSNNPVEIMFNAQWLDPMTLKDLVDVADKFTIQQLLERDMFRDRLANEEPLYLNEVLYPVFQGYDSVAMEVDAELGGRDQLFNMLRGRDLVRAYLGKPKHVLTTPLLPGLDGRKMSKTYGNTVDLTEEPTPMFFRLTLVQDSLLPILMNALTDASREEIEEIETRLKAEHNLQDARESFAHGIVSTLHSPEAATMAHEEFQRVIGEAELPSDIPDIRVAAERVSADGIGIVDLLSSTDLVTSRSDARRLVEQGGIRVNGEKVEDPWIKLKRSTVSGAVLKVGRRGYVRVDVTE